MNVVMTVRAKRKVIGSKTVDLDKVINRLVVINQAVQCIGLERLLNEGNPFHYVDYLQGQRVTITINKAIKQ